ncbi:MAG: hypothetical protein JJ850_13925 [Kordiimonadaceae bacterium]|nr:hypothetical protein [Kordiimonadaceae bacterium]MBO6570189.1 hypothetical protein [Kordiimonadaceae bacterium]MBO6965713.1 hypothetical protein [Kordiimonadaceae bacterium]
MNDFVVAPCNSDAFTFVDRWLDSPFHFGAVIGPSGSGKSHLLGGWLREHGATKLLPTAQLSDVEPGGLYVADDIDQVGKNGEHVYSDELLFHMFNWSKEQRAKVLVSARTPPNQWGRQLPDLVSRLGTVPIASIDQPDDQILSVMLIKSFSDRQLQVDLQVINYILGRMPRTYAAAKQLANDLDNMALAEKRRITKDLARRCLQQLSK